MEKKNLSRRKTPSAGSQGVESAAEEPCAEGSIPEEEQRENKALGSLQIPSWSRLGFLGADTLQSQALKAHQDTPAHVDELL